MKTQDDFLIEIGVSELPTQSLQKLSQGLAQALQQRLIDAELTFESIEPFATPRRLAVLITGLLQTQPARQIKKQGPTRDRSYDAAGNLTPAAQGFAKTCGLSVNDLTWESTPQGERLVFTREEPGQTVVQLMPTFVAAALDQLPIAKRMRWGDTPFEFVRPVQWVVMMYGSEIVPASFFGHQAGDHTYGHRFHYPDVLRIDHPSHYAQILKTKGYVVASFNERREIIRHQLLAAGGNIGGQTIISDALLDEVTSLVEWPTALVGNFSPKFLDVPREALICAMHHHQKSFHVEDSNGALLPSFITVTNIESRDPSQVIAGNERVMSARLCDASFFYETDVQRPLENLSPRLSQVVFQIKLGSLQDKVSRIARLSQMIANEIGADPSLTQQAATLCKNDLLSDMVNEFPELQGIMGYYYAKAQGYSYEVAEALREYYLPRFSGDDLPETSISCALALADRLDTLVGILGINQQPTGDKDPFALRRAALGILRILIEKQLPLDLVDLLRSTVEGYGNKLSNPAVIEQGFDFIFDRLRGLYQEQMISPDGFAAVMAKKPSKPLDFHRRLLAVNHFRSLPEAVALVAANKRVSKLLLKENLSAVNDKIDPELLTAPAEKQLVNALQAKAKEVKPLYEKQCYQEALTALASLREPIDQFFTDVMVMTEDENLRNNRLAILSNLHHLFFEIADISLLTV